MQGAHAHKTIAMFRRTIMFSRMHGPPGLHGPSNSLAICREPGPLILFAWWRAGRFHYINGRYLASYSSYNVCI